MLIDPSKTRLQNCLANLETEYENTMVSLSLENNKASCEILMNYATKLKQIIKLLNNIKDGPI